MSEASKQHAGPVIVVTGASQGIGAAIAERFATGVSGARLVLIARHRERLEAVAARCEALGAKAMVVVCDLTEPERTERMAEQVHSAFGTIDVLVNNAGSWRGGTAHEMPVGEFARTLHENLVSMFAVTRAFLPRMRERGGGDIFFMSSTSGLEGLANNAAYCAAKHGVAGLAKAVRAEVAGFGIRVCCVYPGPTDTPTWTGVDIDTTRLMPASDVAQAIFDVHRLSGRSMVEDMVLRPPAYR